MKCWHDAQLILQLQQLKKVLITLFIKYNVGGKLLEILIKNFFGKSSSLDTVQKPEIDLLYIDTRDTAHGVISIKLKEIQ